MDRECSSHGRYKEWIQNFRWWSYLGDKYLINTFLSADDQIITILFICI
jgi:hypothetical protein